MSDVVGIVLKMTLGLFVKKARRLSSDKLKDGGLNSQELRDLIIGSLQDVERKLGGLARANLLTSVSRIQEGLRLLGHLLDKPNTPTLPLQDDDDKGEENPTRPSNTGQASSAESKSPLDVDSALKLVEVIEELKRNPGEPFTSVVKLFEEANTKATEAFHNEALSVEDRILAAKLRVQSRLLLSLDNPGLASQSCRLYLEELHGLAPIVKDFRSHLEGGIFSVFYSEKRRELVLSVSAINLVVLKFLKSFTKSPVNLYDWPNLTCDDWTYNPLIPDKTVCVKLQNAGIEFPNLFVFDEDAYPSFTDDSEDASLTINSDGDFIWVNSRVMLKLTATHKEKLKVEVKPASNSLHALAIDSNDIVYLLCNHNFAYAGTYKGAYATPTMLPRISVDVVDSNEYFNGNSSFHQVELDVVIEMNPVLESTPDGFTLFNDGRLSFYKNNKGTIEPTYSFEFSPWDMFLTTVTNKYQLVAAETFGYHVRVFEKDGQLIREFELYGGERESCLSIAFNYLTEELVCVSRIGRWFYLSTYELETGVRRHKARLTLFGECRRFNPENSRYPRLTAHCNGPMAVVSDEYALRLQ